MSATEIQNRNATAAPLNAVIIYDTFDLAVKVKGMLEDAAHRTAEPTHWNVKPWRVDILELSPAADVALTEAAEAHLMLLAVRQVQSFLPWLMDWLEQWATCRKFRGAGLAVWDGGNADTRPARVAPAMSQFARRHGLSLIFDANARVEDKSSTFAIDLQERAVSLTPTLQHIREQPAGSRVACSVIQ